MATTTMWSWSWLVAIVVVTMVAVATYGRGGHGLGGHGCGGHGRDGHGRGGHGRGGRPFIPWPLIATCRGIETMSPFHWPQPQPYGQLLSPIGLSQHGG